MTRSVSKPTLTVIISNGEKQYQQAIADYSKIIELTKNYTTADFNEDAHYLRASIYDSLGQYGPAIEDHSQLLKSYGWDRELLFERGLLYNKNQQYDPAIADFTQAIMLNMDHSDAYLNRGIAYKLKGQIDLATADFNKVLELHNNTQTYQAVQQELSALESGQ